MKFLVTLAICAVCVSGESLTRHKRGWGYEPTPPPPTQSSGWGWQSTQPPPPPPPQPQPQPSGWGQPPPTQPPPKGGWGQPQPPPGWGSGGSSYYNNYYPSYQSSRYPRPWSQNRYGRYAEGPTRYRDYRDMRDRDYYGSIRSPSYRRSSSLL